MSAHDATVPPASVQSYLDEVPTWRDGTPATAGAMTAMQKRTWLLASAGKFLEGMIVFMVGVALPLIIDEFNLSSAQSGVVTAAPLLGQHTVEVLEELGFSQAKIDELRRKGVAITDKGPSGEQT